ncbi:MAG: NADH-quinone oxidoreductase subunit C [Acidimicrobiales bacterium]
MTGAPMAGAVVSEPVGAAELAETVAAAVSGGGRFAGLFATARDGVPALLHALVAMPAGGATRDGVLPGSGHLAVIPAAMDAGSAQYPALTPLVPAAAWYEREIHDMFGIEPAGHQRLDPLVLPLAPGDPPPRPGSGSSREDADPDVSALPSHVLGEGVFTIPYGPVRSGVFESIEYLVETSGEEILHLRTRVYHKHRGLERRLEELAPTEGVLLAERVEGTASVAHAIAFSQAIEALAGVEPPRAAEFVRVIHAELERVACHLDSVVRHTEGSGQAVAHARFACHKERVMRLRAQLCGHRFGRGVVVPGGVSGPLLLETARVLAAVADLEAAFTSDARALMATPSFLDRLRGTGRLEQDDVREHGALGPIGRASGLVDDVRVTRPYAAYGHLGFEPATEFDEGDALARQHVRLFEIHQALHIVRQALDDLDETAVPDDPAAFAEAVPAVPDGWSIASVEAPHGELVYLVQCEGGRLTRVKPRCASFHNLALLPRAFVTDIFTDFVFIEASFGLSIAGVSG